LRLGDIMSDYRTALEALEKIRSENDEQQFESLSQLMVRACERAAAWEAYLDPYRARKEVDRDFIENGLPSLLTSVKKIQDIARKYPKPFDAVIWRSVHQAGAIPDGLRVAGYDYSKSGQSGAFIRGLLAALRGDLESEENPQTRRMVKAKNADGLHLHVHGPLNFPSRIDNARQPNARITGLQFELAFHLRRYSARRASREIKTLDKLPDYGDPHYGVIGEFLKCAASNFPPEDRAELEERERKKGTMDGEAFAKVMRKNTLADGSSVQWWGWGAPENPLEDVMDLLDGDADD
jgi:hypothetical protein